VTKQPVDAKNLRADARANREALVAAARRLYAERGGLVPLSAVAQAAGVGIGTLYRHFPAQQDLVVGVMGSVRDEILTICEESLAEMESDPEQGWLRFAHRIAGLQLGTFVPAVTAGLDMEHMPPELESVRAAVFAAVVPVVVAAQREGIIRRDLPPDHVYLGLGVLSRPLPRPLEGSHPQLIPWMLEIYIRGLRP
jgi:AcrR family transcriptional regulator